MFNLQSCSFSTQKESNIDCKFDARTHYLLWLHYRTIYGTSQYFICHIWPCMISKNFVIENENYTVFRHCNFLFERCLVSRKSYMIVVWLSRAHTNNIWPGMITKNHVWPSVTTKNLIWWAARKDMQWRQLKIYDFSVESHDCCENNGN